MKIVITECNIREQEKRNYVIDTSIGAYKVGRLLYFVNLSKEVYKRERDESMRVQAISKYWYSFYDDVSFDDKRNYYIGKNGKSTLHFNGQATYKEGFNVVKNISITRLNNAIKKMQKGENILYKHFEYIISKR